MTVHKMDSTARNTDLLSDLFQSIQHVLVVSKYQKLLAILQKVQRVVTVQMILQSNIICTIMDINVVSKWVKIGFISI